MQMIVGFNLTIDAVALTITEVLDLSLDTWKRQVGDEALDVPQTRLVNIQSTQSGIRLVKGGAVSKGENPAKPTLEGGSDAWLGDIRLRIRTPTRRFFCPAQKALRADIKPAKPINDLRKNGLPSERKVGGLA